MIRLIFIFIISITYALNVNAQDISEFNNSPKIGKAGQTIAFVGEKIGLERIENYCPEDYICMDARFNARYRVIQLLEGDFKGDTIDFTVYDHYGTPRFSNHDRIILYVYQGENGYVHHKYSYDVLNPTKGGNYAYCGDPYAEYEVAQIEENGRVDLIPFNFSPPVKFKLSKYLMTEEDTEGMKQEHIREDFMDTMRRFAPPAFKIKRNTAICKMGMTAKELVSVRMTYDFIPQWEQERELEKCLKDSGLPNNSVTVTQLETLNSCIEK